MPIVVSVLLSLRSLIRSRAALHLEILALRHQLQVLERSRRPRLRLTAADRLLWVWFSRIWSEWRPALVLVQPDTVVALAPARVSPVLDLEEPTPHRPADRTGRRPRVDPHDVSRESALGCASHPRRVAEARDRPESVHRREVHGASPTATVADVADVPREPRRPGDGRRLLRGADRHVSPAVRAGDPRPRTPTRRACRGHRSPDLRVDGAATPQRLSQRGRARPTCCTIATAHSPASPAPSRPCRSKTS